MKLILSPKKIKAIKHLVRSYFKNKKGEPYEMKTGQCYIFAGIIDRRFKWVWASAPTRYGKTEVAAMGLLYLAVFEGLKVPIVAGSKDKAEKIMEYITQHLPDHPDFYAGLMNVEGLDKVEKLKIRVAKDALRWSGGGWIYVTSIDSRSKQKEGEGVVGEGGDVVVLEEAGLIKDKAQFSKIVRMPEGSEWGKLIMIGNCVEKSIFEDAYKSKLYHKVRIDLDQAIEEGTYSKKELEDKKAQTTTRDWKRYYLVEFPKAKDFAYFKPQTYEVLPKDLKYYGAVDLALGLDTSTSLVGIAVVAKDTNGQVYATFASGESTKPDETMNAIFNLPMEFTRFGIEAVQFQKYFLQVIKQKSQAMGRYIPFEGIEQKRKKEERIESMEPAINTGQVLFNEKSILWEHLAEYPHLEKLDVLDALEMSLRLAGVLGYNSKHNQKRLSY